MKAILMVPADPLHAKPHPHTDLSERPSLPTVPKKEHLEDPTEFTPTISFIDSQAFLRLTVQCAKQRQQELKQPASRAGPAQ